LLTLIDLTKFLYGNFCLLIILMAERMSANVVLCDVEDCPAQEHSLGLGSDHRSLVTLPPKCAICLPSCQTFINFSLK